ncbi:unnamed protein product [Candidula unifasciata]|uniref:Ferric-chelate reductase 1 n=1 Tax=Candidula unifasciata TaxID=100452 RepID=A0A8S3ZCK8_9EUPU|nr:unnamed protein product [Candidula unifasciata]
MPRLAVFLLALGILSWIYRVEGYPNGAPWSTCFTRYPKHNNQGTQTTPCPIGITFSAPVFAPGEEIVIKVEDPNPNKQWFSGIQMAAFRDSGNHEEIVGTFINYPTDKLKAITCFAGSRNMITHKNNLKVKTLELTWKAPSEHVGNVTFKATIVINYETFWTGLEAQLPSADQDTATIKPPLYKAISWKHLVQDVDFSGCGDTKGCFLHPQHCTGDNCLAAVSFQHRPSTDDYFFEMHTTAAAAAGWISLGFSDNKEMGDDETISCVFSAGFGSVQHGWNPGSYNTRMLTRFLSEVEIRQSDGQLQCKFVLPKESSAYIINSKSDVLNYTNITFNKERGWYLMLAWGDTMPASDVLAKHVEMPVVSSSKVNLKEAVVHRGSSFPVLVKIHASLMMIAWIFLSGIITVVSRHYRGWMPKVTLFGTKVWFQIHRGLALLVIIMTLTGIAAIFFQYGKDIRAFSIPHSYFGLIVVASVTLQVIAGFFRPGIDHEMRYLFNYGHRILGQTTHILAAVTMFLAYSIKYMSREQTYFGIAVLSTWVVLQLLWHIMYEILSLKGWLRFLSSQEDAGTDSDKYPDKNRLLTILFTIYVLTVAGLCVAALLAFLLY